MREEVAVACQGKNIEADLETGTSTWTTDVFSIDICIRLCLHGSAIGCCL